MHALYAGDPPDAPRWVEAQAGQLVFSITPPLFRGLLLDAQSGVISGFPEVEGKGVYEVTVSNALGSTGVRVWVQIAKDLLAEAQQTPRLADRILLMRQYDPEEADRELEREGRMRLAKFAGPFPRCYEMGKEAGAVKTDLSRSLSPKHSPRSPGTVTSGDPPASSLEHSKQSVRRDRSAEILGAPPGHGMMSRSQLQAMFRDYQLY